MRSRIADLNCVFALLLVALTAPLALAIPVANLYLTPVTAAHAAVGAPMQYQIVVMNGSGVADKAMTLTVNLTAPDSTVYTVFTKQISILAPGANINTTYTLTTSTYSNLTGNFSLSAKLTNTSGTILSSGTLPMTVSPVPASNVAVSVGGAGPVTDLLGASTDFSIVMMNFTGAPLTLTTNTSLTRPDGTTVALIYGTATSVPAGAFNIGKALAFTTADFDAQSGNFTITATSVDSGNNVLATDSYTFTRNPIPAAMYVPSFTESAAAAGVNMPRMMNMSAMSMCNMGTGGDYMMGGSGAAVADFNGDGFDDIYMIDMMGMGHLFQNMGNGMFEDMAMMAGIPMMMGQSAAIFADIDNDGRPDLLVLNNADPMMGMGMMMQMNLYHNNGPDAMGMVTFTDITETSGLPMMNMQNLQGATFGDYDGDGFPDLYIAAHVDCMGMDSQSHLYHNNGNNTFSDVSYLMDTATLSRRGLAAMFVDYNGDGRVDLLVGNDVGRKYGANVLWRNDGPGGPGWIFTDVSAASGAGIQLASMGLTAGDYTNTGNIALFTTNVGGNYMLGYSPATGTFAQVQDDGYGHAQIAHSRVPYTAKGKTGLSTSEFMWGAGFQDFNNDGWVDLFEAAGGYTGSPSYPSALFMNRGNGTFLSVSTLAGITGFADMMPTAVFGDFNNDGFMDAFVAGTGGSAPALYINNARSNGNPYNWLEIKLVGGCTPAGGCAGIYSNRDGIGARIVLNANGMNQTRWVIDGGTFQGAGTIKQHFGLSTATTANTLTVYWPSGKVQTLTNVAANQMLVIQEP